METLVQEPIDRFVECPLNPRKHYDQKKLEELAESIKSVGLLEPLLSRRNGKKGSFEIIAGSRRYRAAKLAGLPELMSIVRDISDEQALEAMVVENNQREDVNPLEEAEGYKALLSRDYSLERLAGRIGRSTKYIYDRIKLLELIPRAKELLFEGKMTAGHAILLARLTTEQQDKVVDFNNNDVWKHEFLLFAPGDRREHDDEAQIKVCSVRELEAWIDKHVRFDKTRPDPMLFPDTYQDIDQALAQREKVVQITYDYVVHPDAKEGNHERIYSVRTWKRADGKGWFNPVTYRNVNGQTCAKSVMGVIVAGPDRGTAFRVCINKDCDIHWGKEKREREKLKRAASSSKPDKSAARREAQERAQQERENGERQAWTKAKPAVLKAVAVKCQQLTTAQCVAVIRRRQNLSRAAGYLHKPKTAEDWLRFIAADTIIGEFNIYPYYRADFIKVARMVGLDAAALVKADNKGTAVANRVKKTKGRPRNKRKGK